MPFDVHWSPEAEADLAEAWLGSSDRMALTKAQHRVDRFLEKDPHQGRYRSEGLYRVNEDPLIVFYEIDDDTQTVRVTNVYLA
jgi:mRNA-degrading endonuclease RelE of RelBE toxin-antitoxin system